MKRNKHVFILTAFLLSFLCFPANKVFAASNSVDVPLTIKQSFDLENAKKNMDLKGEYELKSLDSNFPMPKGTRNNLYSFSLDGESAETTLTLKYLHGGIYSYRLVQTTNEKELYEYDRSPYYITVYIKNGEDGQLIPQVVIKKEDGKKYDELKFQNFYHGEKLEVSKPLNPQDIAKTGDQTSLIYVLVGAGALLLIILIAWLKKKKYKN